MNTSTAMRLHGKLFQGQETWDDNTELAVDLMNGVGQMICHRQFGTSEPLHLSGASFFEGVLDIESITGQPLAHGAATLTVDDQGAATGSVTLDDRYQGELELRFDGHLVR